MKHTINYYRQMLIDIRTAMNPDYNPDRDSGLIGDALEMAVKDWYGRPLVMSKQGRCDIRIGARNYEVKQGGGELGELGKRLVRGSGWVLYIPVVLLDYPLDKQDGYIMDRADFLRALQDAGALRSKTPTRGNTKVTIQTFWNRSKNKPHGRLLDKMLEAFDQYENEELCEFLARTTGQA